MSGVDFAEAARVAQDFEHAMQDLMASAGVNAEEAGEIAARVTAASVTLAARTAEAEHDARQLGPCCVGSPDFLMW